MENKVDAHIWDDDNKNEDTNRTAISHTIVLESRKMVTQIVMVVNNVAVAEVLVVGKCVFEDKCGTIDPSACCTVLRSCWHRGLC